MLKASDADPRSSVGSVERRRSRALVAWGPSSAVPAWMRDGRQKKVPFLTIESGLYSRSSEVESSPLFVFCTHTA